MSKRGLIIASGVGLLFALGGSALFVFAIRNGADGLLDLLLDLVAAAIAGRVLLGTVPVHRYFRLGVPLFAAIAAIAATTAASDWLIGQQVSFGPAGKTTAATILTAAIAAVAYLIAATIYGFAGTRQGVRVGSRTGLLLLLLLAVAPFLNVLGLIGLAIATAVRKPTTRARPAASE